MGAAVAAAVGAAATVGAAAVGFAATVAAAAGAEVATGAVVGGAGAAAGEHAETNAAQPITNVSRKNVRRDETIQPPPTPTNAMTFAFVSGRSRARAETIGAVHQLVLGGLAIWLCVAGSVFAQTDDQSAPLPDDQTPGPTLQPASDNAVVCDPTAAGFRYLEVRGTGFDQWATQRLVGNVLDANGVSQIRWGSVWVSPQGQLTLEVNLCADPFQNRAALTAGDYTIAVGQSDGTPIAATGISLASPDEVDQSMTPAPSAQPAEPTATPVTYVIPQLPAQSTSTPLAVPSLASPTATPGPRTGAGSLQQPYPPGAPGNLVDGWQVVITGVTPDAFSGIKTDIPSAVQPASDQRDFMVRAQATYQGPGTGVFSGVRLALLNTRTQFVYDQIHNSCGVIPDALPPNVVTTGSTVRGNVCFMVRLADIGSLVAFDNQSAESDRLYFALQ